MARAIRIVIDAMGGDGAPGVNVRAALSALGSASDLCLELVGPRDLLDQELRRNFAEESSRLTLVSANQVISMEDPAFSAARSKSESTIHKGIRRLKEGADAFLSAGHSGAVMATALLELGRLPKVERPALVVKLPTRKGTVTLLDVGANVDCRPNHLFQFAQMGDAYAKTWQNLPAPRVGLLSNGSEGHKGNQLTRATHEILLKNNLLNYVGPVEGTDLFRGDVDVVICDGFVGNVVLKSAEGLADCAFHWLSQPRQGIFGPLHSWLMKAGSGQFKERFDYQLYGAAPLLGIDGMVLISHGSSTELAIRNGILTAKKAVERNFLQSIARSLETISDKED